MPTLSISPDMKLVDTKIAPLVMFINKKMLLPTYYSCEGHYPITDVIQSQYPMVIISPEAAKDGAYRTFNFLGILSVYNNNQSNKSLDEVRWSLTPCSGDFSLCFKPDNSEKHPIEKMHLSLHTMVPELEAINQWFTKRSKI